MLNEFETCNFSCFCWCCWYSVPCDGPHPWSVRHKFSLYNLKTFAKHAFPAWQWPVEMAKGFWVW